MRTLEPPDGVTVAVLAGRSGASPLLPPVVPFSLSFAVGAEPGEVGPEALRVCWPSAAESASAAALTAALPAPNALPVGAQLVVLDHARREPGLFARVLPRRRVAPEDACAALLACGYADIRRGLCPSGAGVLVIGRVSGPSRAVASTAE